MVLGGAAIAFQYVWNQKQYATSASAAVAHAPPPARRRPPFALQQRMTDLCDWSRRPYAAQVQSTATGMPMIGGPFTLVDESGRIVTDKDFQGQYVLVYFGFSYCPDICPSELVKMDKVIKALGACLPVPARRLAAAQPPCLHRRQLRGRPHRAAGDDFGGPEAGLLGAAALLRSRCAPLPARCTLSSAA